MSAAEQYHMGCHVMLVTAHDCTAPSAVSNRQLALARGLAHHDVGTRFLIVANGDISDARRCHPSYSWESTGRSRVGRLRRLSPQQSAGLLGVLCIGRDPLLLRRGRQVARHAGVPALTEITEFPDVVVPHRRGRMLYLRALEREISRMDAVLVISTALRTWVTTTIGTGQVFEIPMIVDLDRFPVSLLHRSCRCTVQPTRPLELGYAGSLRPQKDGLDLLLRSLAAVPSTSTTPGPRLTVWGDGPERGDMQDLAGRLGLADRVAFVGMINANRIPEALLSVDCLVLPRPSSRQATGGFPTKLGEYLATARPVIATVTGDIGAKLSKDEAVLVPPDDITSLTEAVTWVANNPAAACAIGQAGRWAAQREFDSSRAGRQLLSAITKLRTERSVASMRSR